jgi:predicted dehydrogenase
MIKKRFQLGFVGGARNSAVGYAHFVASRMDHGWDLAAGAFSTRDDINRQTGQLYGVEESRIYRTFEELVEKEAGKLDAVAILTPTPLHAQMTIRCLEAGIAVICEKSLGLTSNEAKEVERIQASTKGFLAVIYNYSGYPMVRELRRMIEAGELGEIIHFQAEMPQEGYLRTDKSGKKPVVQGWRLKDGPVPVLHLDLAVHLHELIYYLTGLEPQEVVADQSSYGWFGVVDNVTCLCRYEKGVQGQIWFSKSAMGNRNGLRLRVYGSKASAEWFQASPEELVVCRQDGSRQILDRGAGLPIASLARSTRFKAGHPAGFIEALANLYCDIHQSLTDFKKTGKQESKEVFGAKLAVRGLEFLEAMVSSSKSKKWINLGNK